MKKRLIPILALTMSCFMMIGCGAKVSTNEGGTEASNTEVTSTETTEAESEETEATEIEVPDEVTVEGVDMNIVALKGPTAMGMVQLMDESENGETVNNYTFEIVAAIDEVTPKIVQGEVDIAAVPANVASVLYNNTDGEVEVLAINTLGVLYIVENGDSIQSVEDLRGKTIYASGKGATPEYALNYMLQANGIDPEKDVTIEYKSEHSECVAAISANENGIAMLPQPFVTVAQTQNENIRIALDLTAEWESASSSDGTEACLITGVVVGRKAFVEENHDAVVAFLDEYEASVSFVNENVTEASQLIKGYDIVKAPIAEKALPYCNIVCITGEEMQEKLNGYLSILAEQNPKSIGGKLPEDDFYFKK